MKALQLVFTCVVIYLNTITMPLVRRSIHNRFLFQSQSTLSWAYLIIAITFLADIVVLVQIYYAIMSTISSIKLNHYKHENAPYTEKQVMALKGSSQYIQWMAQSGGNEVDHNWQMRERIEAEREVQLHRESLHAPDAN